MGNSNTLYFFSAEGLETVRSIPAVLLGIAFAYWGIGYLIKGLAFGIIGKRLGRKVGVRYYLPFGSWLVFGGLRKEITEEGFLPLLNKHFPLIFWLISVGSFVGVVLSPSTAFYRVSGVVTLLGLFGGSVALSVALRSIFGGVRWWWYLPFVGWFCFLVSACRLRVENLPPPSNGVSLIEEEVLL